MPSPSYSETVIVYKVHGGILFKLWEWGGHVMLVLDCWACSCDWKVTHLVQVFLSLLFVLHVADPRREVPEADVGVLRLWENTQEEEEHHISIISTYSCVFPHSYKRFLRQNFLKSKIKTRAHPFHEARADSAQRKPASDSDTLTV